MKWNKYPETKPTEGSSATASGCLICLEIPNPPIDSGSTPGFGWSMRLAYFFNGKWCFFNPSNLIPIGDELEQYITHYLYLIDIPAPIDQSKNVNELIDSIDKIALAVESNLIRVLHQLTNFSGKQEELPALFANLTWKLLNLSTNLQPNLMRPLLEYVTKENLEVNDGETI